MFSWLQQLTPPTDVTGPLLATYVLLDIFLIVVLARILGSVMLKLNQPRVVGEILAGITLGPTLLGDTLSRVIAPLEARPIIGIIATVGLIMFMFLAGVEFDAERVKPKARQAGLLALLSVALPAILGFPVARLMHTSVYAGPAGAELLPFALFIGAALSVTAFPVMAHILMERGELNSPMGSLGVATTGIMSILMFVYIAFAGAVATSMASGVGFTDFLLTIFYIVLFGLFSWYGVRPFLSRILPRTSTITGNQMAIIFGGMVLYGLIAHQLNINALVGGFVWGMILPNSPELRKAIAAKVQDVAMVFLLPVFFANAGFLADLKLITLETLPITLLVLAASIVGKFLAAMPAKSFGLEWREVGFLGALFNTRGLLVLVVGLIGLELNIITNMTFSITVVVALGTNLMTLPLLTLFTRPQLVPQMATAVSKTSEPG
jgi:Kef-type K+ transport system membrane component KefB